MIQQLWLLGSEQKVMPEVGVESPLHFGQHLGEVWGNGQFSCEKLHYVAATCGNDKPIHRLIFDARSDKFIFIYDDGRSERRWTSQDTVTPKETSEEVEKLQILLDEALAQVKRRDRESGAAIAQAEVAKKGEMKAVTETKEVLEKLQAKEKELAAQQKASKITEAVLQKKLEDEMRARRRAEAVAAECKIQVARMKQAKEDTKESGEEVKAELRLQLANNKLQ